MTNKDIVDSLEELIGSTPLLRLSKVTQGIDADILAKLESQNPGGSAKDRVAIEMIDVAEREGKLKPGGTIIEPTSGNTGVGLAIVAANRGYKCIFVVTDKVSKEKVDLLKAYGAEVVICPVAVEPSDPQSYYSTAERLARETPNSFRPDQYSNIHNPLAHEKTTGPEIWKQTEGKVTHFVAGIGTGGTISGVARYLKSQNPDIKIIGADPTNSVFNGGSGRPYLVEGVGEDFWPATFDPKLVDETIAITDDEAFQLARRVSREEGLLIGGSGALAVAAALKLKDKLKPTDVVVVLIPDSGRGYLSKVYNDEWMMHYGFLNEPGVTVQDVYGAQGRSQHDILYVNPSDTVRHAIEILHKHDISQLPVAKNEPPFAAAEIIGALDETTLASLVFADSSVLDQRVDKIMDPPLVTIGAGESIETAVRKLQISNALLVLAGGLPTAIVSRSDILDFFARQTKKKEKFS
jgi:cystathionine beta-synthase